MPSLPRHCPVPQVTLSVLDRRNKGLGEREEAQGVVVRMCLCELSPGV